VLRFTACDVCMIPGRCECHGVCHQDVADNRRWDATHVKSRWACYIPLIFALGAFGATWLAATCIEIAHAMAALGTWPGL
jgi:hypothetical protein